MSAAFLKVFKYAGVGQPHAQWTVFCELEHVACVVGEGREENTELNLGC